MRLIPPEDAPPGTAETAPMTLVWGGDPGSGTYGGHDGEYLLNLFCITGVRDNGTDIPGYVAHALQKDLGEEWTVHNRGSRLEISHEPLGPSDHELMMEASNRLLQEVVLPRFGG